VAARPGRHFAGFSVPVGKPPTRFSSERRKYVTLSPRLGLPLLVAVAATVLVAACARGPDAEGSTEPSRGPSGTAAATGAAGAGVDPQILSDVVEGAFPVPGRSQLRTIRVQRAALGLPNAACGGENFADVAATDMRFDQAHYADLELIAEKGLTEERQPKPKLVDEACRAAKSPSERVWRALDVPWAEVTRTATQSAPVVATHARTAACLRRQAGLTVDESDPVGSYLSSVDGALAQAADFTATRRRFSAAFATCAKDYFAAMRAQLLAARPALVERNRELLERYAAELAALGYVP
jgi:hypothetical protein